MKTSMKIFISLALIAAVVVDYFLPSSGVCMLGGTAIAITRFSDVKEINAFETKGIKAYTQIYEASSAPVLKSAFLQTISYAQLTGAMTIAPVLTNLLQGDEVIFLFEADASQRVVTFGTGMISSGTLTVTAAKGATVRAYYDGTSLRVYAREIYA